jgi:hypothetical protein
MLSAFFLENFIHSLVSETKGIEKILRKVIDSLTAFPMASS